MQLNKHVTGMSISTVFLVVFGTVLVTALAHSKIKDLDLVKKSSPPGDRYHSLKVRDPFIPLVRKKRVTAKDSLLQSTPKKIPKPKPVTIHKKLKDTPKAKPVATHKKLKDTPKAKPVATHKELKDTPKAKPVATHKERKEPAGMPLIPMVVYKKIQDTDPKMEANLKYYEKLFNNKAELGKMTDKKYNAVVSRYRDVLLRTQKIRESFLKTELQIPYSKLVFVGIIYKKNQNLALVETQDHKGYAVRIGTFMGPNLGIVEDVNKKSIIIAERYRNYLGEVLEKKQDITFKMPTLPS